jgi:thioredoxin reductase (NADPH)
MLTSDEVAAVPPFSGLPPAALARDRRGYVPAGVDVVKAGRWSHDRDPYLQETSVPGIFACRDVRLGPVKRVASAVGEGSMAIAFVHQYLAHDTTTRPPAARRGGDA